MRCENEIILKQHSTVHMWLAKLKSEIVRVREAWVCVAHTYENVCLLLRRNWMGKS